MKKIKWFLSNFWYYKSFLWDTRDFDHGYCLDLFVLSLKRLRNGIKKYQNHLDYKQDVKNINKAIRMIERSKGTFPFDYADRKFGFTPEIIFTPIEGTTSSKMCFIDEEKTKLYYDEVKRIKKLIKKKVIKLLTDPAKGFETWWD